jgi:soluble lytic murein transglycosylase-like protein
LTGSIVMARNSVAQALSIFFLTSMFTCVRLAARADLPTVLDPSAPAAAKQLERLRNQIHPALWQNANQIPVTSAGAGSAYEITASVVGRVGCGGPDMLILKLGASSIDAMIPSGFDPVWLDSGSNLRLIVADNIAQPNSPNEAGFRVLAAAPEAEVASLVRSSTVSQRPAARAASFVATRRSGQSYLTHLTPGHPICALSPQALAIYPAYRAEIVRINPRLGDQTVDKITSSVLAYSAYYKIDPRLIMAMIIAESGFDPDSISSAGAIGVAQLMPETAAGLGVDPYDPIQNVGAAVKILSTRVGEYGGEDNHGLVPLNTLILTMAAYNAGDGAVRAYHGVPPYRETQNYVRKVAALYKAMCGG